MADRAAPPTLECAGAIFTAILAPDATFAAHAEPLADIKMLEQYANWMQGLMTV